MIQGHCVFTIKNLLKKINFFSLIVFFSVGQSSFAQSNDDSDWLKKIKNSNENEARAVPVKLQEKMSEEQFKKKVQTLVATVSNATEALRNISAKHKSYLNAVANVEAKCEVDADLGQTNSGFEWVFEQDKHVCKTELNKLKQYGEELTKTLDQSSKVNKRLSAIAKIGLDTLDKIELVDAAKKLKEGAHQR